MQNKLKHLEIIQGVINRLATNSFQLKGWGVVLVAAVLALLAREARVVFALVALVPAIVFWGLDGFFLWQERLYRALYDDVRGKLEVDVDFSMDTSQFKNDSRTWWRATWSSTLTWFYGILILMIIGIMIALAVTQEGG